MSSAAAARLFPRAFTLPCPRRCRLARRHGRVSPYTVAEVQCPDEYAHIALDAHCHAGRLARQGRRCRLGGSLSDIVDSHLIHHGRGVSRPWHCLLRLTCSSPRRVRQPDARRPRLVFHVCLTPNGPSGFHVPVEHASLTTWDSPSRDAPVSCHPRQEGHSIPCRRCRRPTPALCLLPGSNPSDGRWGGLAPVV